jgi:hypothetical protein
MGRASTESYQQCSNDLRSVNVNTSTSGTTESHHCRELGAHGGADCQACATSPKARHTVLPATPRVPRQANGFDLKDVGIEHACRTSKSMAQGQRGAVRGTSPTDARCPRGRSEQIVRASEGDQNRLAKGTDCETIMAHSITSIGWGKRKSSNLQHPSQWQKADQPVLAERHTKNSQIHDIWILRRKRS